jgi:putative ATPase
MKDLFNTDDIQKPSANEFETSISNAPLAYRMRPRSLEEFVGQEHILAPGKLLYRTLEADRLSSVIFYGPPGSGKTTLAYIVSKRTKSHFVTLNAVTSNVAELRKVIEQAKKLIQANQKRTIVFIDEIHRFNKAQQDVLMPVVESGGIVLIGATTQNPSFSIVGPLLSRSLIFELRPLSIENLESLAKRALDDKEKGLGNYKVNLKAKALRHLAETASGDARRILNALEVGVLTTEPDKDKIIQFNESVAAESVQRRVVYYDWDGDYHFDSASAFIKSLRGSDPDAALYWAAKMLEGGEDPRFLVRRMIILASEDVGNADPDALQLAMSAAQAVEYVGMPEARIIIGQLVTYLACAPKSNASYLAIDAAIADVKGKESEEVPKHLRGTGYAGAERLGSGEGYKYAHSFKDHFVVQDYREGAGTYYQPTEQGFEKTLKERLEKLKKIRGQGQGERG